MRMRTRYSIPLIVLVCTMLLSADRALAQFSQQGPKLVGSGAADQSEEGTSVAISGDGNTAIVGGYADNTDGTGHGAGAVWVWTRTGGVWTQQGAKLVGADAVGNALQGYSVSLSADGNTALVGGFFDNGTAGAAWVWTRTGGVWTQQGPKLVGTGAVGSAAQGLSVALSADGNTAIVGGYVDNSNTGAAWVWTRSGGVWRQQGPKLVGAGALGNALQGYSVSLSADGNTALVGGYVDNSNSGAAWVWTRSGGVWSQQGRKLVASDTVGQPFQGTSVALSADGNTAIVGGQGDNLFAGAAWAWTRTGGIWTQQGAKLVGSGAVGNAIQGYSVSLSADGNTAIVGGYVDNAADTVHGTGAAWVWTRTGGVWNQQGSKLVGAGAVGNAEQGVSVSLSADSATVIVGGLGDNNYIGAAWIFAASHPPFALTFPLKGLSPGSDTHLGPNSAPISSVMDHSVPQAKFAAKPNACAQDRTVVAFTNEIGSFGVPPPAICDVRNYTPDTCKSYPLCCRSYPDSQKQCIPTCTATPPSPKDACSCWPIGSAENRACLMRLASDNRGCAPKFVGGYICGYEGTKAFDVNEHYNGGTVLWYDGHAGFDYPAKKGTEVYAAADGIIRMPPDFVVDKKNTLKNYDAVLYGSLSTYNALVIDHGNGYTTWYLHLTDHIGAGGTPVKSGDVVKAGTLIGHVGDVGIGGGNYHLHFEVRKGTADNPFEGHQVDPYGWQPSTPGTDPYLHAADETESLWLTPN
jgi:prepilin-type processing-associated H-X9-DG protein